MPTKLYSISQVAEELELGRGRVWQLIVREQIPAYRIGGCWVVTQQALAACKRHRGGCLRGPAHGAAPEGPHGPG